MKAGHTRTQIARNVGVHKATISRELTRNLGERGYRPKQADELATARRKQRVRPRITVCTMDASRRVTAPRVESRTDFRSPHARRAGTHQPRAHLQVRLCGQTSGRHALAPLAVPETTAETLRHLLAARAHPQPRAALTSALRVVERQSATRRLGGRHHHRARTTGKPSSAWSSANRSSCDSPKFGATRRSRSPTP